MNICIIANRDKDKDLTISKNICELFEKKGIKCVICEQKLSGSTYHADEEMLRDADIVVTVGGDGTLLQAARDTVDYDIRLIGVNRGTLGYLTEINIENISDMVDKIAEGTFYQEDRMMIKGTLERNGEVIFDNFSLNDIVIYKNSYANMISVDVYVDDQLLTGYDADGVIVSTPTGSTAYNLSAGGPLIVPSASMMVLTPVCAHVLNSRSVVIPSNSIMKIVVTNKREYKKPDFALVFDGAEKVDIIPGDVITITGMEQVTKMIRLSETSFYKVLQKKLSI